MEKCYISMYSISYGGERCPDVPKNLSSLQRPKGFEKLLHRMREGLRIAASAPWRMGCCVYGSLCRCLPSLSRPHVSRHFGA